MACAIDGCTRPHFARGWCNTHYYRWRRHGDPLVSLAGVGGVCSIEGCDTASKQRGWCHMHYERWRRHGDPLVVSPFGSRWTGDEATYKAVHLRVKAVRGPASRYVCACGEPAKQWAYDHTDPSPKMSEDGRPYSLDIERYTAMCVRCHKNFDMERLDHKRRSPRAR